MFKGLHSYQQLHQYNKEYKMIKTILAIGLTTMLVYGSTHRQVKTYNGINIIPKSFVIRTKKKNKTIHLSTRSRAILTGLLNGVLTGEAYGHKHPIKAITLKTSVKHSASFYLNRKRWHPITGIQFTKRTLRNTLKVTADVNKYTYLNKKNIIKLYLGLCYSKGIILKNGKISKNYLFKASRVWASIDRGWSNHKSRYKHNKSFVSWWALHAQVKRQLKCVGLRYS